MTRSAARKAAAPAAALVLAILATVFGKKVGGVQVSSVGGYLTTVLASVLVALHGPKAVRKVKHVTRGGGGHHQPEFTTLYDMVTAGAIRLSSTSPDAVAAYADGLYENVEAIKRDYPNHRHVTIAVRATDRIKANFLDVERGDATPQEVPGWILMQLALRGLSRKDLKLIVKWDAQWDRIPRIPAGFQGKQYDSLQAYDVSIFLTSALNGDPIGVYASASTWPAIFARLDATGLRL